MYISEVICHIAANYIKHFGGIVVARDLCFELRVIKRGYHRIFAFSAHSVKHRAGKFIVGSGYRHGKDAAAVIRMGHVLLLGLVVFRHGQYTEIALHIAQQFGHIKRERHKQRLIVYKHLR